MHFTSNEFSIPTSGTISITNDVSTIMHHPKLMNRALTKEENYAELQFNVAGNDEDDLSIVHDKHNKVLYVSTIDEDSEYFVEFSYTLSEFSIKEIHTEMYNGVLIVGLHLNQFEDVS